ncbi:RNA-dependent DNA polymerase [Candidatus Uhrbacteria bacterium]|nr:RNA-dependent DNA polymerase [Candidatus Uhrbacteria bacterium]
MSPGPPPSNFRSFLLVRGGVRDIGIHRSDYYDLFSRITSIENLFIAWERFRKGKRSRQDVMFFERYLEDNLFALQAELASGVYQHSPYDRFTIHDPKQRTIHKADVKDRVVHQAIVNVIELIFEKRFIYDSYSCRVGKGTHAAIRRLQTFLRKPSANNTRTIYVLKCDIRKFFASVNHETLKKLIIQRVDDPKTLDLLTGIIESFSTSHGTGIPLGNLTSQLFANIYLHELDWYVKQELRVKHYIRYCDDFVLLSSSKHECLAWVELVNAFLKEKLSMQLHPNKISVRTWTQGVDFLGYVVLPHSIIIRPSTARRALRCSNTENKSSYLGLCKHADAYRLENAIKNAT